MSREHVDHADLARFAQDRVNLPREKAASYRKQARGLRSKLEKYLKENPDFTLRKIQLSGSLAKGTALRSLNDIDMACYISGADTSADARALVQYLADRLRTAYPNFNPDQVTPQTYSVTVSFLDSGLDVDVVPVLYDGDPDWYGDLISQEDGEFLRTNIPFHLDFIRRRKDVQPSHFAQVVRLVKFWARNLKQQNEDFRFKSFMIEMILSHLCDGGCDLSDYPEGLQHFFTYIACSDMRKQIVFEDYYQREEVGVSTKPVQIIDPVNPNNNVSRLYSDLQADAIVTAAQDAGDAIDAALVAPTKGETVAYWGEVFGPSFQVG